MRKKRKRNKIVTIIGVGKENQERPKKDYPQEANFRSKRQGKGNLKKKELEGPWGTKGHPSKQGGMRLGKGLESKKNYDWIV